MDQTTIRRALLLAGAGALVTAVVSYGVSTWPTTPDVPATAPAVTTTVDERPTPTTTPAPPPPAPEPVVEEPVWTPEPTWTPEPVWTPEPEPVYQEPELWYCDYPETAVYTDGTASSSDPRCFHQAPAVTPGVEYTDEMGSWVYICTPDDPRPEAECTVPAS